MLDNLRKNLARIIYSGKNSMSLPNQFLKYGSGRKVMDPNWARVMMSDEDHYTGYSYAAITKRARAVARIASQYITTELANNDTTKEQKHPYLSLIRESTLFSENQFWQTISTYLDLEGVFYLMAVRAKDETRTGSAQYFKMLNPYNIKRILKKDTFEIGGYRETRKGFERDIPAEMVIEIRELNPFDEDEPFAMTDAARESSFTLKSSGDYTRHALQNNVDAPGIITTDIIMPNEEFTNFVNRMKDHTKGEPVFGNGSGSVNWQAMDIDISKAALKDINEVQRDQSFAVYGMSKTMMGIEQSGTTRETSNVQKELHIENEIVPRINLILDALNLDYKTRYADDYAKTKISLGIKNPIESDQDVEVLKTDNKQKSFDLFTSLVDAGYDEDMAAKYANGDITLDKLGKPKNPPKPKPQPIIAPGVPTPKAPTPKKKQFLQLNEIAPGVINDQESMLQNAVVNLEMKLAVAAINRVPKKIKNAIDQESDLITQSEKEDAINELEAILIGFYGVIATIQGKETMADRALEFGFDAPEFALDTITRDTIAQTAELVAASHVDTIANDLYTAARGAALEGATQREIIAELKDLYSHDITENRARTIARTETNRAFTMSQYEADRQFINQNNLQSRAYKAYHTRSANPCEFCIGLALQGEVPFGEPFVKKGDTVTGTSGKEYKANFESVYAGNLHPNCSCDYTLVIRDEVK